MILERNIFRALEEFTPIFLIEFEISFPGNNHELSRKIGTSLSGSSYSCVNRDQGPRSKFSSGGAKEECVKENFFVKLFYV